MAFDEDLADRLRKVFRRRKGVSEKKMFGGRGFMLNGNMCCDTVKDKLMLRLGEDGAAEALSEPHVREMDFTGKPIKTMVFVVRAGLKTDEDLRAWGNRATKFAGTLPAK
jgi:TfoX/Sxy family transcriptional regulator of competence genes